VRAFLNDHRHPLAAQAARLYPSPLRVAGTTLLAPPGWIYDDPVDVAEVVPRWRADAPPTTVTGREPASRGVRPAEEPGTPFDRYSEALAALAPPRIFENRRAYRLVDADAGRPPDPRSLTFAPGRYFDVIDVCEAVGHEFADAAMHDGATIHHGDDGHNGDDGHHSDDGDCSDDGDRGLRRWLPWRDHVGDPFDTARRPAILAVSTLVLRRESAGTPPRMLLHRRDPRGVASGGGLVQVAPVGIFQPSDDSRPDDADELDPWKATVRELAEELLGRDEAYGVPGEHFDYDSWPFYRDLARARAAGSLTVSWLGIGVDPLTLVLDALQVAVFDAEVFDQLLSGLVTANAEGDMIAGTAGIPFTAGTVDHVTTSEPMQSAGAALLRLAFRHRHTLLADS
jgi:hypothetical protein